MSLVKWFDGDSKEAMQKMVKNNLAFLVYIGEGRDELTEILNDTDIIHLLNNELILCFKMDPASLSFKNFEKNFDNIVIPSIYLLEKYNSQQHVIRVQNLMDSHEMRKELKLQILNAIHCVIKSISDTINATDNKQKYLQYLTDVNHKLQVLNNSNLIHEVQKVAEENKKTNVTAKIKIKVPCLDVTLVQEFQTTSSLYDVKTFVLNNVNIANRPLKFIAHRPFVDEDFCQTLDALNLCPSSTVYVHMIPSEPWLHSILNYQPWIKKIFQFAFLNPYNLIQNYFVRRPLPVEVSGTLNHPNVTQAKRNSTFKPGSNIHRLKSNYTDDDENNTYNGNSTQQL